MNIWIIFIGFMILSWIVSMVLKSKFTSIPKYLSTTACQEGCCRKNATGQWYYRCNS